MRLFRIAWYDYDLVQYQHDRADTELEKTFEDRKQFIAEHGQTVTGDHLKPKPAGKTEAEWQQSVKGKKTADYYNKLHTLETDQLLRETKLREESHQLAIPGEKIVTATPAAGGSSVAKGMASMYEQKL